MAKANRKGRSVSQPFVMLPQYVLRCAAWRSLSPTARAAFVELAARYNGSNNGRIGMSVRDMAESLGVAGNTAQNALNELQEKGFIEVTAKGYFSMKQRHATEWRLTMHRCDRTNALPSKAFLRWNTPA